VITVDLLIRMNEQRYSIAKDRTLLRFFCSQENKLQLTMIDCVE